MKRNPKLLRACTFIIICTFWISILSEIMKPKMLDGFSDVTRKVRGFYAEETNSLDFIFLGSSRMYSAVNPAVLWDRYGITSYDLCCNEQSYSITYYYLKEALKKQKPKAVVVDISFGVGLSETREPMRHLNFAYLKPSINKIKAINANAEGMERLEYLFSISKWHSSWYNLQEENFRYIFKCDNNPYKGYSYVEPVEDIVLADYDYPYSMEENMKLYYEEPLPENLEWIEKMVAYTREKGVDLILITVPDGSAPESQGYYNGIFKHVIDEKGVICKNYNLEMPGEHHLTAKMAESFTEKLGEDLIKQYKINNKQGMEDYQRWEHTSEIYKAEMHSIFLKEKTDWKDYIENLKMNNYDIFLRQTPWMCDAEKWKAIKKELEMFGVNLPENSQENYAGIMSLGGSTEILEKDCIEGRKEDTYYKIDNNGILIDGQIYSSVNGLQLVIYDNLLRRVVDSVYIEDNDLQLKR